jgi:hypothetical protein
MATTIKLKNGSGAPLAGDLVAGEPALDLTNKRLYTEDSGGTVIEVGTNPTSVTTGAITGSGDMAIDTDTLFVDVSANAVGIGTTSPNATLKVQGPVDTATLSTSSTPAARINNGGAISNWIGANGYNYGYIQSIQDDGTNNLKPLALQPLGGNVGIGTSSPSTALHVQASSGASRITVGTGGVAGDHGLNVVSGGASNDYGIFFNGSMALGSKTTTGTQLKIGSNGTETTFQTLTFHTNATEAMRIDSSGRLLVGTTSTNYAGVDLAVGNTTDGQNGIAIQTSTTGYGHVLFGDGTGSSAYVGQITYKHGDEYMAFYTAGSETMRIDSSGNVGIGSSNPDEKLEVNGDIKISGAASGSAGVLHFGGVSDDTKIAGFDGTASGTPDTMIFYTDTAERMRIDSSGNVQIKSGNELQLYRADNGVAVDLYNGGSGVGLVLDDNNGDGFQFKFAGSEKMRIDSSGNLLVGKTSADYTTAGVMVEGDGTVSSVKAGVTGVFNRLTSDGDIVQFRKDSTTVGSIGVRYSNLYTGRGTSGLAFSETGLDVHPFNPSTLNDSDAQIDLGISTSRFKDLYLSGGAYLGGTGSANKLDDYEEGTWTPTSYSGWNTNPTSWSGKYIKIGQHSYSFCRYYRRRFQPPVLHSWFALLNN